MNDNENNFCRMGEGLKLAASRGVMMGYIVHYNICTD